MNRSHAWMSAILVLLSACFALTAWRQTGENIPIILAAVATLVAALVAFQGRAAPRETAEPPQARPLPAADLVAAPAQEPSRQGASHGWVTGAETLEQQIESAAEAAKRYSRTLGVISIQLGCYEELAARFGAGPTRRAMQGLCEMIRGKLRQYDVVSLQDDDRLIVSVAFIRERSELLAVGNRLRDSISALQIPDLGNHRFAPKLGFAMYPLHGYTAQELIAFASKEAGEDKDAAALPGAPARSLPAAG